MSDDQSFDDSEPTRDLEAVSDEGAGDTGSGEVDEFARWRADNEPLYTEPVPAAAGDDDGTSREPGRWRIPVAILAVLALLALILGLAAGNDDPDEVASTATSSSTSSSSTSSSTSSTTSSTVPIIVTTPTTGTSAVATTVTTGGTTATTARPGNRVMSIEASWAPEFPRVGQTVTFDVRASDPDASPIREGPCGTGNGVSFGDGGRHATSCGAPCPSGLSGSSAAGSNSFRYSHAYSAPGLYTVTMTFSSGDRCSTPGASVQTLTFNITVTE